MAETCEMGVLRVPSMDIQPNWQEVIRDSSGKFWVSCRQAEKKTLHGYLQRPPTDTVPATQQKGEKFVIKEHGQRTLTVECPQADCTTTFVRPMKVLPLHSGKLLSMDVSGSGALGVCSSEDGRLWVWDADTGETRRNLEGHVGDVYMCRFFPSGIVVLSGGADLRLKIWSVEDGSCPRTLTGHTRGISDSAVIDRGRNIISVSTDGSARLWDCGTAKCLATVANTHCPINACAVASSAMLAGQNTDPPTEPECGTNDKILLVTREDGKLQAVDIRNRKTIFTYSGSKSPLSCCAFVSETTVLCGAEDGVMSQVDLRKTDEALQQLSFGASAVTSLLPLGESKCICGHSDGSCVVWNIQDPMRGVIKLTGPELDMVTSVRRAGRNVYTGCRDGSVRVYSIGDMD